MLVVNMIADLFKFLTKKELEDRLREMGLKFEQLGSGRCANSF